MEYLSDTEHRYKKKTSILLKCNSMSFFISKIWIIIHPIYFDHVWAYLDKSAKIFKSNNARLTKNATYS